MDVKQLYEYTNQATQEVIGQSIVLNEDLSNIVDVGKAIFDANAVDNYVKKLVNHIGKVVFVNRPYSQRAPRVLMDAWEFGSVLEKVSYMELPAAEINESWELHDREKYEQDFFYQPKISVKFFNSKTTFEIPISITEMQVKQSFSNPTQLNSFISMIYTAIYNSMTVKTDALIMATINNFTAETLYNAFPSGTYTGTTARAINLLKLYNDGPNKGGTALTKDLALSNLDFLKFASMMIRLHVGYLQQISTLYNIEGAPRFTPRDMLHVVMLDYFATASDIYLNSDTYHNDMVKLPDFERVSYWQGTGKDMSFGSISKIDIKSSNNHSVEIDGILCVMFDRDALGVTNNNERTTSHYNAKGEFDNFWFKRDASYFNAQDENFIVFFIQ